MDWVLTFDRAKSVYDAIFSGKSEHPWPAQHDPKGAT